LFIGSALLLPLQPDFGKAAHGRGPCGQVRLRPSPFVVFLLKFAGRRGGLFRAIRRNRMRQENAGAQ